MNYPLERRIEVAQTREGAKKAQETLLKRLGSKEAVKEHYSRIGKLGGMTETDKPKGFAANRELAVILGSKGGKISKRGPAKAVRETEKPTSDPS